MCRYRCGTGAFSSPLSNLNSFHNRSCFISAFLHKLTILFGLLNPFTFSANAFVLKLDLTAELVHVMKYLI